MRNLLVALALVAAASFGSAPAQAEGSVDVEKAQATSMPRKGTTRLTNAAYRKILDLLESSRHAGPQSEPVALLMWTEVRAAVSKEAAERGEWSKPVRGWVLGRDRRGALPEELFETTRGVRLAIVYTIEPWRRQGRRLIDYRDERFVTIEADAEPPGAD